MEYGSRRAWGIIILLIIIVGLAFAVWLFWNNQPVLDLPDSLPGEQTPIKHYQNSRFNIAFDYPSNYQLTENESADNNQLRYSIVLTSKELSSQTPQSGQDPPGEGPPAITIDIYSNDQANYSPLEWVRAVKESNFGLGDKTYREVVVAERPAISYTWSGLYQGESRVFTSPDNKWLYHAAVSYFNNEDVIRNHFNNLLSSLIVALPQAAVPVITPPNLKGY